MNNSRRLVASAALATSVLVAACSSSAGGSPQQPPVGTHGSAAVGTHGSAAVGTSTAAAPATSAGPSSAKLDVCAAMPAATLASLSGIAVTKASSRDDNVPASTQISIGSCTYTGGVGVQLDITVDRTSFAAHLFDSEYSANKQVISKTALVPGIGDKAFTADFPSMWLEVLWGNEQLKLDGASTISVDAAKRVLTALHDKL